MTETIEREYLGRSAAGNRVGIYVERRDWDERYFVGRAAELPCAMHRWWTDTTTAWDLLWFNDLGYPTVSTTTAIGAALVHGENLWTNYRANRHQFNLYIEGTRFDIQPCRWGCGELWPRDCPHAVTFGVYDVLNKRALPMPDVPWRTIVDSNHFEYLPEGI